MKSPLKPTLTIFAIIGLVLAGFLAQIAIHDYSTSTGTANPILTMAMKGMPVINTAYGQTADLNCDGTRDDIQWQAAVDHLSTGGKIIDLCGVTYTFTGGSTVAFGNGDITIEGIGGKTYFELDGNTSIFSDGGYARCLFKDFRTDGGDIEASGTNSYRQNVWIGSTYYFEPAGGGGGNVTQEDVEDWAGAMWTGNTETRVTVTYDDGAGKLNIVVDDMNDDVPESGDFGNAAGLDPDGSITDNTIVEADLNAIDSPSDGECLTYNLAGTNFEWETCGGGGGCTNSIGSIVTDSGTVTISGCDDGITISGAGGISVSASGSTVTITGVLGATIETGEITNDTILEIDLDATNEPTDNYILSYDAGSTGFTWVVNNDSADDLSDNNASDLGDISYSAHNLGDMLYSNSTHWIDFPATVDGYVLTLASSIPTWSPPSGGMGSVFGVIHPPSGEDLIAQGNDTVNFTSTDLAITGTASTDTVNFELNDTSYLMMFNADEAVGLIGSSPQLVLYDGTNRPYWTLQYPYDSTTISWYDLGYLADSYTSGNITIEVRWVADAITGGIEWDVYTVGIGDNENSDPAKGSPVATINDTVAGTTRYTNYSQSGSFTPSWSTGDWCWMGIERDHDAAGDTMTDYAEETWLVVAWPSER